jgi:hypothetical protein
VAFSISAFTIDRYDDVLALWKECEGVGLSGADSGDESEMMDDLSVPRL